MVKSAKGNHVFEPENMAIDIATSKILFPEMLDTERKAFLNFEYYNHISAAEFSRLFTKISKNKKLIANKMQMIVRLLNENPRRVPRKAKNVRVRKNPTTPPIKKRRSGSGYGIVMLFRKRGIWYKANLRQATDIKQHAMHYPNENSASIALTDLATGMKKELKKDLIWIKVFPL